MSEDLGIEAVRTIRQEISRQFDDDPTRIVKHYMEMQARFKDRLRPGPEVWTDGPGLDQSAR